ncbi:uncharacterized protein [Typha angustifolia]|uniref:uncharacterized protein n=1 Tax=Typha angustifolia TaxID=59011 RepID=UPI003C2E1012
MATIERYKVPFSSCSLFLLSHRSSTNAEAMISSAISSPIWAPPYERAVNGRPMTTMDGYRRLDVAKKYVMQRKVEEEDELPNEEEEEEEAARETTTTEAVPFKACELCGTSTTPLWRTGPNGPKSVCNACGIKYRKRRRSAECHEEYVNTKPLSNPSKVGIEERLKEMQRKKQERMLMLVIEQRRKRKEWKMAAGKEEEAEAALLLMSLSSGILFHS